MKRDKDSACKQAEKIAHKAQESGMKAKHAFKENAQRAADDIEEAAISAKNATKTGIRRVAGKLEEAGTKVKNATKEGATAAAHKVKEVATQAANRIKEKYTDGTIALSAGRLSTSAPRFFCASRHHPSPSVCNNKSIRPWSFRFFAVAFAVRGGC